MPKDAASRRPRASAQRLPPGRHGLPPELVKRNQRERMLAAFAQAVAKHGYRETTITHISEAASVSRNTFYEQFADKEECFVAAYGEVARHMEKVICDAAKQHAEWTDSVAAGISAAVDFFVESPDLARLCLVESTAAGSKVIARHGETIDFYAKKLKEGRPEKDRGKQMPEAERVLVSGAGTLIARRLNEGREDQLETLLPDLVEIILGPTESALN